MHAGPARDRDQRAVGRGGGALLVMLAFSSLCPDFSKSPHSPARLSLLLLGSERATHIPQTPRPTALSPVRLPPHPAGTPTPAWPTGLQASVGGDRGEEFLEEPAKIISELSGFGGLSPRLSEPWYQVWRFPNSLLSGHQEASGVPKRLVA